MDYKRRLFPHSGPGLFAGADIERADRAAAGPGGAAGAGPSPRGYPGFQLLRSIDGVYGNIRPGT
ncbi:hypothetical protein TRIP_E380064 [uncultured Spirochaetota bacterium]|uniref:Uncharacterized protein n=1 Tax=uncultured Spirochaetota bacterium TaxID=460511 RepID=A0A652ZYU6_9SPIR|nr:hypothetical protein TRIP_E380064 [uncultured Spirochaetota bacterium]